MWSERWNLHWRVSPLLLTAALPCANDNVPVLGSAADTGEIAHVTSCKRSAAFVALLSFNFGAIFLDRSSISFLIPFIAPDLHLSNARVGLLSSGTALMWAASSILLTPALARHMQPTRILSYLGILTALSAAAGAGAESFPTMLVSRLAVGLFAGPVLPISQAVILATAPARVRGLQMGIVQSAGSSILASVIAPPTLVFLALTQSWRGALVWAAALGPLSAWLIVRYLRIPTAIEPSVTPEGPVQTLTAGIRGVLRQRNIVLCSIISMSMVGWLVTGITFYPLYLVREFDANPAVMSEMMSALGLGGLTGAFLIPYLSDRLGRRAVILVTVLLGALAPMLLIGCVRGQSLMTVAFFVTMLAGGTFPLFMAVVPTESVSPSGAPVAIGLIQGLGESVGGVAMPLIAGIAADSFGLSAALVTVIACVVVAAIASHRLRETAPGAAWADS
jgi:MFS transporter, ACS family, hexuronate transporter